MTLEGFLACMNAGKTVTGGSKEHLFMIGEADQAMRITAKINGSYHTQPELRALMSELIGKRVPESFAMFPPFTSDCGKNTTFGEGVFINSGCRFQDQGGLTIGDGCQIGHNVVIATLNHAIAIDPIPFLLR